VSRAACRSSPSDTDSDPGTCASSRGGGGRRAGHHQGGVGPSTTVSAAKKKTVKLTLMVVASYVVCYGPWFVVQMWAAWDVQHAPYEGVLLVILGRFVYLYCFLG